MSHGPLAYSITFHTYGTWLHGDDRGSVDSDHNLYGDPLLEPDVRRFATAAGQRKHAPVKLDAPSRRIVDAAVRDVARHRGWTLHALHVRTNHVHAVVGATAPPERVLNDFKAWATRALRAGGAAASAARPWARHGSTRYLWTEGAVENACRYVVEGQGEPLE